MGNQSAKMLDPNQIRLELFYFKRYLRKKLFRVYLNYIHKRLGKPMTTFTCQNRGGIITSVVGSEQMLSKQNNRSVKTASMCRNVVFHKSAFVLEL